jgi:hypothetical protein
VDGNFSLLDDLKNWGGQEHFFSLTFFKNFRISFCNTCGRRERPL